MTDQPEPLPTPPRSAFRDIVDAATDGCGCACHTGVGYNTQCEHCISPPPRPVPETAPLSEPRVGPRFDECECGDYRHQHEEGFGRCLICAWQHQGWPPCRAFKLSRVAPPAEPVEEAQRWRCVECGAVFSEAHPQGHERMTNAGPYQCGPVVEVDVGARPPARDGICPTCDHEQQPHYGVCPLDCGCENYPEGARFLTADEARDRLATAEPVMDFLIRDGGSYADRTYSLMRSQGRLRNEVWHWCHD